MNLNKIRSEIQKKIIAENLARQSNGDTKTINNGLVVVPEGLLWKAIQQLHNEILPKLKTRGEGNKEYLQFTEVRDALIWSAYIQQCYENLMMRYAKQKQLLDFFEGRAVEAEKQLLKYFTAAEILSADTMADFRRGIVAQAIAIIEPKI